MRLYESGNQGVVGAAYHCEQCGYGAATATHPTYCDTCGGASLPRLEGEISPAARGGTMLAVVAALALLALMWLLAATNSEGMETCQAAHTFDVCALAILP